MKRLLFVMLVGLVSACAPVASETVVPAETVPIKPGELTVENVRANMTVPSSTGSVWMVISNGTDSDEALLGATMAGCGVIELHEMEIVDDVMVMREVEGGTIPIPAGETVELKPGGLHIMCIEKEAPLEAGTTVEIALEFANAGTMDVMGKVVAPGGMTMDQVEGDMDAGEDNMEQDSDMAQTAEMEHDSEMHHHGDGEAVQMHVDETILGTVESDGFKLQLVSHAPLHAGYNQIMVHLNNADGEPVSGADISFQPMMTMFDGKNHAAGIEQPVQEMPGMYHGAVAFPMPSGPELGAWTLTVTFSDPATGSGGETVFDIEVKPSKLSGSFVAADDSKIFLMVVQPLAPDVGAQPFEVFAMEKESMVDWPPLEDLELDITPWMPTMDHGSPDNENPTATGAGHYLGQANFTMGGLWTVKVAAGKDGQQLGEVTFEYVVP